MLQKALSVSGLLLLAVLAVRVPQAALTGVIILDRPLGAGGAAFSELGRHLTGLFEYDPTLPGVFAASADVDLRMADRVTPGYPLFGTRPARPVPGGPRSRRRGCVGERHDSREDPGGWVGRD